MEASGSQIHVFTSLYSFSDDDVIITIFPEPYNVSDDNQFQREQYLSEFCTSTATADIPFEWIDNKVRSESISLHLGNTDARAH
ncbi:MAG: hypothetical protein Q9200_000058 [Gallowayella weberi]